MKAKRLLSRRELIGMGAAALALPSFMASSPSFGQPVTSPDRSVRLIPAQLHAEFRKEVKRLYPGLLDDPKFQAIQRLSTLIVHERGPHVYAYCITWQLTDAFGNVSTTPYFRFAQPGNRKKFGQGKNPVIASGSKPVLLSGQTRLVTPFFTLSPQDYKANPTNWLRVNSLGNAGTFLATELNRAEKVRIALNGIVYSDMGLVRSDKCELGPRLTARRTAEHDECRSVSEMIESGASKAEVEKALYERATVALSYAAGREGWYQNGRRRQAQVLSNRLSNAGLPGLTKLVAKVLKLKKMSIHRLAS